MVKLPAFLELHAIGSLPFGWVFRIQLDLQGVLFSFGSVKEN